MSPTTNGNHCFVVMLTSHKIDKTAPWKQCRKHIRSLRPDKTRLLLRFCFETILIASKIRRVRPAGFPTAWRGWIFQGGGGTTFNDVSSHLVQLSVKVKAAKANLRHLTTISTFNALWPLNKKWKWQHSQFLRCFDFDVDSHLWAPWRPPFDREACAARWRDRSRRPCWIFSLSTFVFKC